jgi:nucleoside-diphosphate-sugar epimerase
MDVRGRRVLVTGGGGFIGSHLTERLAEHNEVTVYDSGARDALRFTDLAEHPRVKLVRGDVLDRPLLRESAEGVDVVIHLAAVAGVPNYSSRPVATMETNMLGAANLLRVALEIGRPLFVNFSSSEVYGPWAEAAREGDATAPGPAGVSRWTYAVSKLAAEHLCLAYHREHGLPVISIRPFNVYGPRQVGEGAVRSFVERALRNETLHLHDDGSQRRAWCYVDDLVEGCLACLATPGAIGEVVNLGNPDAVVSVRELAETVVELCASRSRIESVPYAAESEVHTRSPDIGKATALLGFRPRVALREGLARTVEWQRSATRSAEEPR